MELIKRSLSLHDYPPNDLYLSQFVQRRNGPETATRVEIQNFHYPFIIAARIGDYEFS